MFYNSHPNIYVLIDALQELQERAYVKMNSADRKKAPKSRTEKEEFIRDTMYGFESGVLNRMQFVKTLSHKFLPDKL